MSVRHSVLAELPRGKGGNGSLDVAPGVVKPAGECLRHRDECETEVIKPVVSGTGGHCHIVSQV